MFQSTSFFVLQRAETHELIGHEVDRCDVVACQLFLADNQGVYTPRYGMSSLRDSNSSSLTFDTPPFLFCNGRKQELSRLVV
ncbi:MAG: hypothetical protein R2825_27125 [Saprospiraceae bacterium]